MTTTDNYRGWRPGGMALLFDPERYDEQEDYDPDAEFDEYMNYYEDDEKENDAE